MKFDNILIPVDFTVNTEVAVKKAVELYAEPNASIHLLHVPGAASASAFGYQKYLSSQSIDQGEQTTELEEKLAWWEARIKHLRPDITTFTWIAFKIHVEKAIAEKAKRLKANLIIIGKNSQHSLLPFLNSVVPSRLVSRTGIPVLTVKPGALNNFVRTVVVPVGPTFPENKIAFINWLTDKFFVHVRLLILVGKEGESAPEQNSLIEISRRVRQRSLENISHEVLRSSNKAWDILTYCKKVEADLLVVHPESETKIGWFNRQILDELPVDSKTQVLEVS